MGLGVEFSGGGPTWGGFLGADGGQVEDRMGDVCEVIQMEPAGRESHDDAAGADDHFGGHLDLNRLPPQTNSWANPHTPCQFIASLRDSTRVEFQ